MKLGTIVQNSSNSCDSNICWSILVLNTVESILNPTIEIIKIKIVRAWSWKNINCSISGEAAFWNPRAPQVGIFEGIFIHKEILNQLH
jgi:hypothetical protein